MKIAYLYHRNAAAADVQSGRPASILQHFLHHGLEVERVFPLGARPSPASIFKKIRHRLSGRYYRGDRDPGYLDALAREAEARIAGRNCDVIFSPGSEVISALEVSQPIIFCADATFSNMVDYYWDFSRVSAEYLRKGHAQEAAALKRAALAIYPSEWAARSAIEFYGADPKRVEVIPFGANLGAENQRADVQRWIAERPVKGLRLLFVGRDWKRKGGDIVLAAAEHLAAQGISVEIDLVGCKPPGRHRITPWIKTHGLLRPNVPEERSRLTALFKRAHFAFIPSRAETYGMTFAEANAFGVPVIATATGGIPSIVRQGINGFLLPISADGRAYAEVIAAAFNDHASYLKLAHSSFDEFDHRLNWRAFCTRYLEIAGRICGLHRVTPKSLQASTNENRAYS